MAGDEKIRPGGLSDVMMCYDLNLLRATFQSSGSDLDAHRVEITMVCLSGWKPPPRRSLRRTGRVS